MSAAVVCLVLSFSGFFGVFVGYPGILFVLTRFVRERDVSDRNLVYPFVSFVIVARNAEDLIDKKIRNCLMLTYPEDRMELVIYSDGSDDDTFVRASKYACERIKVYETATHEGKIPAMNAAVSKTRGDILVFSDADALLPVDSLMWLVGPFSDPAVAGVCGQRVISRDSGQMKSSQKKYIQFDSTIKRLESRLGRVTSNDGKLYAIRRHLFEPIRQGVTDDLFLSLTVIKKGGRFLFEPMAKAYIKLPSRSIRHEIMRRRRIVSQSLAGLFYMRGVFDPFRFGLFAVGLFMNKVLRRLLPLCLLGIFVSCAVLALDHAWAAVLFLAQVSAFLLALSHPWMYRINAKGRPGTLLLKSAEMAAYFVCGNVGMLLGVVAFLSGQRIDKWDPVKSDG